MSSIEYDSYGNPYGNWIGTEPINLTTPLTLSAPLNIVTTSGTTNISWPNTAPMYINIPPYMSTSTTFYPPYYPAGLDPNAVTLTPELVDTLFEKMVTVVKPGERVIICVDQDLTSEQCREVSDGLTDRGFDGIVLRGARAGVGFKGNPQNLTREETRVDTLARILELWQQCPELKLTSLLEWYHGEEMNDEDFAAAVEVHFQKVTNGIHKRT